MKVLLSDGVDVRGYLHGSVDPDLELTRIPKPNVYAFAQIARTGRLDPYREVR